MAIPSSRDAFWRTKGVSKRTLKPTVAAEYDAARENESSDDQQRASQAINDAEIALKVQALPFDSDTTLAQEGGFIALFLRVYMWRERERSKGSINWQSYTPFTGRVSHYQPMMTTKIGEGACFDVYKRYDGEVAFKRGRSSTIIVMKESRIHFDEDGTTEHQNTLSSLISEIDILSMDLGSHHPNIVRLLDLQWDNPLTEQRSFGPTLYLEFAQHGTLYQFCSSESFPLSNEEVHKDILLGVCEGLRALHRHEIAHGDLKPDNVLIFRVGNQIVAKLSDFGCAMYKHFNQPTKASLRGLSQPWDAPEAGTEIDTTLLSKTDIYSYGLLCWWYCFQTEDPFGIFGGRGKSVVSEENVHKMQTFKQMKQREDLAPRLHKLIENAFSVPNACLQLPTQIHRIAQETLLVDARKRSLANVEFILGRGPISRRDLHSQSLVCPCTDQWDANLTWSIPLRLGEDRLTTERFVRALKQYDREQSGNFYQQRVVKIFLFRCYFLGFGAEISTKQASIYLWNAAQLGDANAQALVTLFYRTYGFALPSQNDALRFLCIASSQYPYVLALKDEFIASLARFSYSTYSEFIQKLSSKVSNSSEADLDTTQSETSEYRPDKLNTVSPLTAAVENGWSEEILSLLDQGLSLESALQDHKLNAFHFLCRLRRSSSGEHILLPDVAKAFKRAGAMLDYKGSYSSLVQILSCKVKRAEWDTLVRDGGLPPLSFAVWFGDLPVVHCLLELGAVPDLFSVHLAAGTHQKQILDTILNHPNCPVTTTNGCALDNVSLFDTVLSVCDVFSDSLRFSRTEMTPLESGNKILLFLLSYQPTGTRSNNMECLNAITRQTSHSVIIDQEVLKVLVPTKLTPEILEKVRQFTNIAIMQGNTAAVQHIMKQINTSMDRPSEFLEACVRSPKSVEICQILREITGRDLPAIVPSIPASNLITPFQVAVACQNFAMANFLFETGAKRDEVIRCQAEVNRDLTMLGWLVETPWHESERRIRYLFEEYSAVSPPHFIVAPVVGRSVLQHIACRPPQNAAGEADIYAMMTYLASKYHGPRHIDYQRIDESGSISEDQQHAALVTTIVDGISGVVKNKNNFRDNAVTYESTKLKEYNGTALHHAVRSANLPAVKALLEAGADVSSVIGILIPQKLSVKRQPHSTYAVKENVYASTVRDFAQLVVDQASKDIFPASIPDLSSMTKAYFQQCSQEILNLLINADAGHSVTFIGRRNEVLLYQERREKGNVAALRMFKDKLSQGLSQGYQTGKSAWKESWAEHAKKKARNTEIDKLTLGNAHYSQGRLQEALSIFQEGLADAEEQFGPYAELPLKFVLNLGNVYRDMDREHDATQSYNRVLEDSEATLGPENSLALKAVQNIGGIHASRQQWKQAIEMYQRAMNGKVKELGYEDPGVLSLMSNMAIVYSSMGENQKATEFFDRALTGLEGRLGTSDPQVLKVVDTIGDHHLRNDRVEEAEEAFRRALIGCEKVLGPDNHQTMMSVHGLARVMVKKGNLEAAIDLYQRVFAVRKQILGYEHADTLRVGYGLGTQYQNQQNWQKASDIFEFTLKGEEKRYGRNSRTTLLTVSSLAQVYRKQKRYEDASNLFKRILDSEKVSLTTDDRFVPDTYFNLAQLHLDNDESELATLSYEAALSRYERILGEDARTTLTTTSNIAQLYRKQKRYKEASELYERILIVGPVVLIPDDRLVPDTYYNLGLVQVDREKPELAESSYREAITRYENILGENDSETLEAIDRRARTLTNAKMFSEAIEVYGTLIERRSQNLGENHEDTENSVKALSRVFDLIEQQCEAQPPITNQRAPLNSGFERSSSSHTVPIQEQLPIRSTLNVSGRIEQWTLPIIESVLLGLYRLDLTDLNGSTALHWTILSGHVEESAQLLELRANVDATDSRGRSALHWAALIGEVRAAQLLLKYGAALHLTDNRLSTPLHLATGQDNFEVLQVCLTERPPGAPVVDFNAEDEFGLTVLNSAAARGNTKIVELLIGHGADVDYPSTKIYGYTSLICAAQEGKEETLRSLLKFGANAEYFSNTGHTALHVAAQNGRMAAVRVLLDHGVSIDAPDLVGGWSALFFALAKSHTVVADVLLDAGANLDYRDFDGRHILHRVCQYGQRDMAEYVLDRGVNIEIQDEIGGSTPLMFATERGSIETTTFLLERGANPKAINNIGAYALHYAATAGQLDAVELLIRQTGGVDIQDGNGFTPLHIAVLNNREDLVRSLLKMGVDTKIENKDGKTALQLAATKQNAVIMSLLILGPSAEVNEGS